MAQIQIEPVSFRTSTGAVLSFVCTTGNISSKQIGKITLLGRTAMIEVPDNKASALISVLDGAKFQDRLVRVQLAGKITFDGESHFQRLADLLELEADAEKEAARKAAQSETATRDGAALTGLLLRDSEFGLGGRLLLTFTRSNRN